MHIAVERRALLRMQPRRHAGILRNTTLDSERLTAGDMRAVASLVFGGLYRVQTPCFLTLAPHNPSCRVINTYRCSRQARLPAIDPHIHPHSLMYLHLGQIVFATSSGDAKQHR